MTHCQLIQAGEIQVVVGDASRDGVGGTQYCGLWSLTSKHRPFNAFGNSYAGLLPGELRGKSPTLEEVDAITCALVRKADERRPVDVRAAYQVVAPYYVDHVLTFCDRKDARGRGMRVSGSVLVLLYELSRGSPHPFSIRRRMGSIHLSETRCGQQYCSWIYLRRGFGNVAGDPGAASLSLGPDGPAV